MRRPRMLGLLVALTAALLAVPIAGSAAYADATVVTPNGSTIDTVPGLPSDVQSSLVATDDLTNGSDTPTVDATGTRCETSWVKVTEYNLVHIELFWFKLYTYWCWNGVIVTYHHTYPDYNITTYGGDVGWEYDGIPAGIQFNCYIAAGSNRQCSGNHEIATAKFRLCVLHYGCIQNVYIRIEEWENYHGQFLWGT